MSYVSDTIIALNPDIINFCEVEGCDELNLLKEELDPSYNSYLKKVLILEQVKMLVC